MRISLLREAIAIAMLAVMLSGTPAVAAPETAPAVGGPGGRPLDASGAP